MEPAVKKTTPALEQLSPSFGSSFLVRQFEKSSPNQNPFWHFHPEIELVHVEGGNGKRHIGNHISYYQDGDLMLIGSNVPHYGFTDRLTGNKSETVIQIKEDFLGPAFLDLPEMDGIKRLFQTARQGIAFHGTTKVYLGHRIRTLVDRDPFDRLIEILNILHEMANSEDMEVLHSESVAVTSSPENKSRINKIFDHVREHYKDDISLEAIAEVASMTVPSFCRYFKKATGKTFTHFVNEYRVVHASKLLAEGSLNITDICLECGFNNFSHFNGQFKAITGKSPSEYRKELKSLIA